jgi:hypothetical protein
MLCHVALVRTDVSEIQFRNSVKYLLYVCIYSIYAKQFLYIFIID